MKEERQSTPLAPLGNEHLTQLSYYSSVAAFSAVEVEEFDAHAGPPVARTDLVSMRMILPNCEITIISVAVVDQLDGAPLLISGMARMLMTPLPLARLQAVHVDVGTLADAVPKLSIQFLRNTPDHRLSPAG